MAGTHFRSDIREKGAARTASFSTFQGNLTGNVTGDVLGDVTGDVLGDLVGNVSGGDVTATDLLVVNASITNKVYIGNAASNITIDKVKGVRLNDGTEAWDDLRFPVSAVRINAANDKPDTIAFIGNTRALGFDNAASEWVTFSAQMPHAYKQGTDVEFHVHWAPTDDSAGNVRWVLEYTWANIGDAFGALATIGVTSAAASVNVHTYADANEITGTGKTFSSMLMCRLIRDVASDGDTYAADAALLEADFHYRIDGFGSEEELVKTP